MNWRYLAPTAFPIEARDVGFALRPPADSLYRFRVEMAARLGVRQLWPVASGRTALALLLGALRRTGSAARQEVVLPAYTCPSLVKVILDAQLKPRLVDLCPESLDFAPGALAQVVGEQTLALIFVHPFGLALDVGPAAEMAHRAGAVLIEDAAQAMGACAGGLPVGTRGDYGLFSTGPGKPLALGGGGFLTANFPAGRRPHPGSPQVGEGDAVRGVQLDVLEAAWAALPGEPRWQRLWPVAKLALMGLVFHPWGWRAAVTLGIDRAGDSEAGQGYALRKLAPSQAAAGVQLLARWEATNAGRRSTAQAVMAALADAPKLCFPAPQAIHAAGKPIFLRLPVLAPDEATRDRVVAALRKQGIGAGKMYGITLAERFPRLGIAPEAYGGAMALARRLFTLPTHYHVAPRDRARMVAIIQDTLR